ncbi:MazG nucleotide pyrophosphohydrolase domain-containing protein [Kocuria sp.]|uniref:MazG nucleotide pyrophosphohydrolase domain-containing protein n=1 Tax=Kocuria sp. TaxID=1871328 RepID=UPI00289CF705|nr:MazG nucleotide pyrophosphohydrolase domain-containing protein [Kocuria sp.]
MTGHQEPLRGESAEAVTADSASAPGTPTRDPSTRDSTAHDTVAPDRGTAPGAEFERLLAVMDRLRSPGGCPWDAAQTHESLLRYLVEESYEVVEAVEALEPSERRRTELVEELGDVLLQVVFHSRIGQEHPDGQRFDISDVLAAVTDKLVRRHPAVFSPGDDAAARQAAGTTAADSTVVEGTTLDSASPGGTGSDVTGASGVVGNGTPSDAELAARWDAVKRREKPQRTRIFDGIPPALPALAYAEKALSKARRHGVAGLPEPRPESDEQDRQAEEDALGEELFRRVQDSSARGLDAERALRTAVRRFVRDHDAPLSPAPSDAR